ncbi:MAG: hypothetical protein CVV19_18150 [Gammaproteobacteria bacterium HGW-Gammaproteobacteria-9]|jgi:hypothetical protein|uniref:DUF2523 domain-containing protein n=1 Tax=Stutzerimonas decontaminans TaxID=3022791 RepID=A0ABX4W023_9GAMM|nr:DUF2523 domain-containing protein [Stutzerimonas decontaminans]MCW8156586.1 DUF2523 domain-containing protein [Stutzerimonas stutzeri]OCX90863.1 MAG: hypothetical protein BFD77_20040 [Pseudomonas sp. CO183]PKL96599.1 MAG: hypothetical protein CVV19_18150 [Gammaproteobacteria bacterium HGW-Gammaproteobacteria-9]MCQ4245942.1 DUF2523 domain-containing protein [Stutzerimonas decontaminans]PNF84682.1 hypothetical protein CXK93_10350 [Stutzerimonas decontaminans]
MQFLFIVQMLVIILGPLVKMVLKILGFGFVTYLGFNLIIGQAQDYLFGLMGDVGPVIQGVLGLAKFDVVVNLYFAAISTRFMLAGIDKATDRRRNQVWRKPGGTSIDA